MNDYSHPYASPPPAHPYSPSDSLVSVSEEEAEAEAQFVSLESTEGGVAESIDFDTIIQQSQSLLSSTPMNQTGEISYATFSNFDGFPNFFDPGQDQTTPASMANVNLIGIFAIQSIIHSLIQSFTLPFNK